VPVIIEPEVYDPVNDEWVQVVRDAETGKIVGTNTRKTPFDQSEPEVEE
jgi:hypothetical protein